MKNLEKIMSIYPEESFLIADGFDAAIIAIDTDSMRIIYDTEKCISIILSDKDKYGCSTFEQAVEYFDIKVKGSYVGERTPMFVEPIVTL